MSIADTQQMRDAVAGFTAANAVEARRLNAILSGWTSAERSCPLCGATVAAAAIKRHVEWHLRSLR
jgi:hypothetical protein